MIVRAALRAAGSTAALVAIYYLLPLDHASTWVAVTILVIGLAALIALVAFQVRWIITSPSRACGGSKPSPPAFRCSCSRHLVTFTRSAPEWCRAFAT